MIRLEHITIKYKETLLDDASIVIPVNKLVVLKGSSGIGKTALLYRLALISTDSNYEYFWDDEKLDLTSSHDKTKCRKEDISFVLQGNDVVEHVTVLQNIQYFASMHNKNMTSQEAKQLLEMVSLDISLEQNIMTLSLGERQRFLIACALIKEPKLLILDEPTASLDIENEQLIFTILKRIITQYDIAIVLASHSEIVYQYADIIYNIENKKIYQMTGEYSNIKSNHNSTKKMNRNFYFQYATNYFKSYQFMHVLMILVATIALLISVLVGQFIDAAIKENKEILTSQFENKIVVTKDVNTYINQEISNYVERKNISENSYPLIKLAAYSKEDDIYILPYFDNDNFGDKLQLEFNTDKGVYIDHQTFINLASKDEMALDITIYEQTISDGEIAVNVSLVKTISGVFKEGVTQNYIKNSKRFIYMYYQDIEKIYYEHCQSEQYIGWVQTFDNYQQLEDTKQELEEAGYHVNDDFVNTKVMNDMMAYYQEIKMIITSGLFSVGIVAAILLGYNLHTKRKKEVAMLKLYGLKIRELFLLLFLEMALEFITTIILVFSLSMVVIGFITRDYTVISSILIKMSQYYIILIPLACIEIILFISSIDIEKQLRDR